MKRFILYCEQIHSRRFCTLPVRRFSIPRGIRHSELEPTVERGPSHTCLLVVDSFYACDCIVCKASIGCTVPRRSAIAIHAGPAASDLRIQGEICHTDTFRGIDGTVIGRPNRVNECVRIRHGRKPVSPPTPTTPDRGTPALQSLQTPTRKKECPTCRSRTYFRT